MSKTIMWILMVLTLAAGVFGAVLFTELGQLLNLPSGWLYAVYPNLGWASVLVALAASAAGRVPEYQERLDGPQGRGRLCHRYRRYNLRDQLLRA